MMKLNENKEDNSQLNDQEVNFEPEGDSFTEHLVRTVIDGYKDAYNRASKKHEIDFSVTITNHKVATPDGNKDVAYLRLDRALRDKKFDQSGGLVKQEEDEGWSTQLLHQEVHFFKNMQERLNPKTPWKEALYLKVLARLTSAGLEYAEVLQQWKKNETAKESTQGDETERRMGKLGLVKANEPPAPLTKEDEEYKKWLTAERQKSGL